MTTVIGLLTAGCADHADRGSTAGKESVLDGLTHIEAELVDVPDVARWDDRLAMDGQHIDIRDGVDLYVLEEGEGPSLVLVNGGPGNTLHSFLPHFAAASSFAHVIYYDQRGTGLSDWEPGDSGYSTTQAVEDLEALRKALGVSEWFVLGHSYGGLIAQWYAMDHPERVLGLILVGSSVPVDGLDLGERDFRSPEERRRIREVYAIDGQSVVPVHSSEVDLQVLRRMIYNGYLNGDWKRQYFFKPDQTRMAQIARYEWVHDVDFNRHMRRDGFARNLAGVFSASPLPTLIVEGRYDANWGPEKPALLAAEHPGADLAVVDSASHFPFAAQPNPFFDHLERFVTGVPPVDRSAIAAWKRSIQGR